MKAFHESDSSQGPCNCITDRIAGTFCSLSIAGGTRVLRAAAGHAALWPAPLAAHGARGGSSPISPPHTLMSGYLTQGALAEQTRVAAAASS